MATNGAQEAYGLPDVLAALATMRGSEHQATKKRAHEFLENFQKSKGSWGTVIGILQSDAEPEAKLLLPSPCAGRLPTTFLLRCLSLSYLPCSSRCFFA
ncbi:unnamed protein product [Parascedosporium putredinis]|uniref:Importin N-terminal domain-containing protein n=1 Tax=Parascedosporium putredinis TaxID=1442378 RepID=A0A9P1M7G3_9PEZI|nr:unnamed protein product [Parascedosporium putredinis]CAI7987673.1 unnamed protein product [Parascedosporium putredinis]